MAIGNWELAIGDGGRHDGLASLLGGFVVGCVVIVLSAFLCGCDSQKTGDAGGDAAAE